MIAMNKMCARGIHLLFFVCLVPFVITACGEGDGHTTLNVEFIEHPSGGEFIQELQSSFSVTRNFEDRSTIFETEPPPNDIDIRFEWWFGSPGSSGSPVPVLQPWDLVIDTDRDGWRWTVRADPDSYLVNEWWVRATWRDDDGRHEVDSRRALCLPLPSDVRAPIVSLDGNVKEDVDTPASNLERLR